MDNIDVKKNQQNAISAYELNKIIIQSVEGIELKPEIVNKLKTSIKKIVMNDLNSNYFALMSPHFNYLTFFVKQENTTINSFIEEILSFILEESNTENLGEIKDFGLRNENTALEIWIGNECYYLFSYRQGVIEI